MRNRFQRVNCVFHFIGNLLRIFGLAILVPLIVVLIYWGQRDDGMQSGEGVWWTGYPMSVQLEDETIFTVYTLGKTRLAKDGDKDFHTYLAGSRYTGDYVQ